MLRCCGYTDGLGVPGRANPPARWSRAVRRVWVFRLHSEALRLISIPVKLQGPHLQLVHDPGLGGDLGESAASLCPLAKIVHVGHGFLAIGATPKTSEGALKFEAWLI